MTSDVRAMLAFSTLNLGVLLMVGGGIAQVNGDDFAVWLYFAGVASLGFYEWLRGRR